MSRCSSVFCMPPYRMGPYRMKAIAGDRSTFPNKSKRAHNDWNAGTVSLDRTLTEKQALYWFTKHLVTAIHYRSGLNDRSNEESFTHSLASGLVELAQQNDEFWPAFNAVLEQSLSPGARWSEVAVSGFDAEYARAPDFITYRGRTCTFSRIPVQRAQRLNAYGYYLLKQGHIQLSDLLHGPNFALVVLHEVLHFLHECEGLKDSTKERPFIRGQARILLRFLRENPNFWGWWLSLNVQCQLRDAA